MEPEMYVPQTIRRSAFGLSPAPQARIYKTGLILLNRAAVVRILGAATEQGRFILYVYRDLGQIGIRAARSNDPAEAVIPARAKDGQGALLLHVISLFRQFGIDPERAAGLVNVASDERNGLAVLSLPKGSFPVAVDSGPARERLRAARERAGAA